MSSRALRTHNMTRLSRDFATMQKENLPAVSADVTFLSSRFPNYKIGADNQVLEIKDAPKTFSMKETVARETAMLLLQQKRLSVRDLASKFEKGLAAAAKLSEENKLKEAASLEKHVLLKKLRDALEALRGRVTGKNKDDVDGAIAMLCGVRGGGNAAAQAIFWQVKPGQSFIIAFETERDRNAAIMLARRFAFDCNIMLAGPGDRSFLGT